MDRFFQKGFYCPDIGAGWIAMESAIRYTDVDEITSYRVVASYRRNGTKLYCRNARHVTYCIPACD